MRLTPLDIRKQEFTRGLRGYDAEEVLAFLQMLSSQWEDLLDESRRKDEKIRDLENKMAHYEKVEEALQEALQTARETSKEALQNAEEKARLIINSAEQRAEEIKRDAGEDLHQIKRDTAKLSGRRSEIVTRLRAFLMSEMEILAHFEGDDPVGFIKLVPGRDKPPENMPADTITPPDADVYPEDPVPADEGNEQDARPERSEEASGEGESESNAGRNSAYTTEKAAYTTEEAAYAEKEAANEDKDAAYAQDKAAYEDQSSPTDRDIVSSQSGDDVVHENSAAAANSGIEQRAGDILKTDPESQDEADYATDSENDQEAPPAARWTNRTVISQPSEHAAKQSDESEEGTDTEAKDGSRASSDEIEKIRRILSDFD